MSLECLQGLTLFNKFPDALAVAQATTYWQLFSDANFRDFSMSFLAIPCLKNYMDF